ncbi:MAG: hypothetical protein LBT84_04355 [Spirochaetia bacterium]|nr:hypothetical protein [Spirochaetia bacterium]
MKKIIALLASFITVFTALFSCAHVPTLQEKADAANISIVSGFAEWDEAVQELFEKCVPTGRIEYVKVRNQGDVILSRASELNANALHIYYFDYAADDVDNNYIVRFWKCKEPLKNK